jgi:competence protein ComFC
MCESLSLKHICNSCQKLFLTPKIYKRQLVNGVQVISFYRYEEIKDLLHTKHTDLGFHIYHILAKNSFEKFANEFHFDERVLSIAIDDHVKGDYSHTAILNHHLKSTNIKPLYSKLRAQNSVSYSGKSRSFRELNPRNFKLKNFRGESLILVDDIVTSGATLSEAIATLKSKKKEVLFCLTLCDVSNS